MPGVEAAASTAATVFVSFDLPLAEYECSGGEGILRLILFGRLGNEASLFSPRLNLLEGDCLALAGGEGGCVGWFSLFEVVETSVLKFSKDGLAEGTGELNADSHTLRSERGRWAAFTLVRVPS